MREKTYKSNTALNHLLDKNQKDKLHLTGIYKLTFENSDNFYIGSTTESFKLRFLRHFRDLKLNKHCNNILQSAYNKYNNIFIEILETCEAEKCIEREQHYIDLLNPKYNICKIAGNTYGIKPSLKCLEKTSKKIDMFDINGNFIKTFNSISEGFRQTGICPTCIGQAIRKKGLASGYQFRYHGEFKKLNKYENPLSYKLLLYSKDGNFIKQFESMLEASTELNIPVGNICKHLKGDTKICYNYIFKKFTKDFSLNINKYEKLHKKQKNIIITDLQTEQMYIFNSLRSLDSNIANRSTISKKIKEEGNEFILKNKYKVQIKPTEVTNL